MIRAMRKPAIVIVSPALADANNGNWQTARRWQRLLSGRFHARVVREWTEDDGRRGDVAMIALHARRSAAAIQAWANVHPGRGLAVVLTGTDLYRDIAVDSQAQRSLVLAQALVVLQAQALRSVPAGVRAKARVVHPSISGRSPLPRTRRHLRVVMVGHLRAEKSPGTLFEAARLLAGEHGILVDHIGAALDPALEEQARATMACCPGYRWLGGLPHEETRRRIQRAHLLVHPSLMEGGAHVIMEAVRSGTPVLASRVEGNVGMLGETYPGYFEVGSADALVRLLRRCRDDLAAGGQGLLSQLRRHCDERAALFDPAAERAALIALVEDLIHG